MKFKELISTLCLQTADAEAQPSSSLSSENHGAVRTWGPAVSISLCFFWLLLFCFDLICFLKALSICDLNSKTKILWKKKMPELKDSL